MSTFVIVSSVGLWLGLAATAFMLLGLVRNVAELRWRLDEMEAVTPRRIGRDGLRPGTRAPDFDLEDLTGGHLALHQFRGREVFLVFTQPGCGPCDQIVPELPAFQQEGGRKVLIVCNGNFEEVQAWAEHHSTSLSVLRQSNWDISKRYEIFATPFAFIIDEQGVIVAKGTINTKEHIGFLLANARKQVAKTGRKTSGWAVRATS
jgi:methylamine dehydrogenase accessory protein MauD